MHNVFKDPQIMLPWGSESLRKRNTLFIIPYKEKKGLLTHTGRRVTHTSVISPCTHTGAHTAARRRVPRISFSSADGGCSGRPPSVAHRQLTERSVLAILSAPFCVYLFERDIVCMCSVNNREPRLSVLNSVQCFTFDMPVEGSMRYLGRP